MRTRINKLYVNEVGNQIIFDIASIGPTNYLIHSVTLEKFDNLTFPGGIPTISETPFGEISHLEVWEVDDTLATLNSTFNINPLGNSLLFVFVHYAAVSNPATIVDVLDEIFVIHNEYSYAKAFNALTKKLNQDSFAPKELIDLILLKKTIHYACVSSNYSQANVYFQKLIKYYD